MTIAPKKCISLSVDDTQHNLLKCLAVLGNGDKPRTFSDIAARLVGEAFHDAFPGVMDEIEMQAKAARDAGPDLPDGITAAKAARMRNEVFHRVASAVLADLATAVDANRMGFDAADWKGRHDGGGDHAEKRRVHGEAIRKLMGWQGPLPDAAEVDAATDERRFGRKP
ncbi:MAG: hypothetical protein OXH76_13200 [Boseongicola sp.]|nr:hypothetical protein [Boseongicola sp.]